MFIPDAWIDQFRFFVGSRGGTDFAQSDVKNQPTFKASFRGSQIWAYTIPGGYQFFGENLDELESMWKTTVEEAQKSEAGEEK